MANSEMNDPSPEKGALIKRGDLVREAPSPVVLQLGGGDDAGAGAFSFSVLWQALLQRLKLATPLGVVLAAVCCVALSYFSEPKYRSYSTLRIQDKQPILAFQTTENSMAFAQTQIELLRGRFIISQAIQSKELGTLPELLEIANLEDPVLWISQRLKATRTGQSSIYEVSFTTREPESARKVVESIVDTYMGFQTGDTDLQRHNMLETLKDEVKRLEIEIERRRTNLREIKRSAVGDDTVVMNMSDEDREGAAAAVGRFALMNSLQQKLVTIEVEIEVAKARIQALSPATAAKGGGPNVKDGEGDIKDAGEDESKIEVPESYVAAVLARDPVISGMERDLQSKSVHMRSLAEKHPKHSKLKAEIEKLEAELKAKKDELTPKIVEEARDRVVALDRDALKKVQSELSSKKQAADLLRERILSERAAQGEHADKSLELHFAHNELRHVEDVHKKISDRIVHLRTESRAPAQVDRIHKATLPEFPDGPTLAKKLAMVGFGAFFAPFVLLIGWDLMHRRVFERQQLEREFDLKIVSEIAALPVRAVLPRPGAERAYQLQSHLFEESVNALRTSLAVDEKLKDCHVFMVASAVSGEGKTNLSAQLAMSWSHAIQGKVVIIDADLRAPNIHELFDVTLGPGLAEVLRGDCPLEKALVMDWGDRLFVLPAGAVGTTSPSHLFSGPRFRNLLAQLRTQFDKIIIDVPPVLCASETLLIGKEADGVLMCARHDYSRSGHVKQAYDRLSASGVKIVGAVLNGAPVRKYSYSYRGYAPV